MINTEMRWYDYLTYTETTNEYGAPQLNEETSGRIKLAIYTTSQSVQDNINYSNANYIGLTLAPINDSYVIKYGEEKLKVLYVQPKGRYKQVFLTKI
jgi:hypothetical protein